MITHLQPDAIQHAIDHLTRIPRPDRFSTEKIRQWLQAQGLGLDLDPETTMAVTLHYKPDPEGNWVAQVAEQMPLSQAVMSKWQDQPDSLPTLPYDSFSAFSSLGFLKDWSTAQESWSRAFANGNVQIVDELPQTGLFGMLDEYAVFQGLFHAAEPMRYSPETLVAIDTKAFQAFIWTLEFHDQFITQLDDYWAHQSDDYATLARVNFIAACNKQVKEGSLDEAACELAWRVAGLLADDDDSISHSHQVEVRMLNVYGYVATDIPCLKDKVSGLTLLYIPGNSSPLHPFENEDAMKAWIKEQCMDAHKRKALMAHFRLQDLPDGLSYSGLEAALAGLASYEGPRFLYINNLVIPARGWSTVYINYNVDDFSPVITEDLFSYLTAQQKQRSYDDAQFLITTRSDVMKAKWRGYLNIALTIIAPLALVVPGLGWVVAVGGIAQLGVGLDEIINGKTREEKIDGATNVAFGALCALPLAGKAWSVSKKMFQTQLDSFVAPGRVNGQIGYLLSPPRAPRVAWGGSNFPRYFEQPVRVKPLDAPAQGYAISRETTHEGMDTLLATQDRATRFLYDLDEDAFVRQVESQLDSPTRYIAADARLYSYRPGVDAPRVVTDTMRQRTLRNLGIDVAMPVEVPRIPNVNQTPVPRKVFHLWLGDKPISPAGLVRLGRNSRLLRDAGYEHHLFLSYSSLVTNGQALAEAAPELNLRTLESQRFFSEMHPFSRQHFEAAMEGPMPGASHVTAATDMLKYHALYQEGGLYMDIDNDLLATRSHPSAAGIINEAAPEDWIGTVLLQTTPDGLLLEQPTSNAFRGVHQQFNTSVIGSHPNNPTLREVIREMESRLDARPGFFRQKQNWPKKGAYAPTYATYAKALNEMTGIDMFNHVVDRNLPAYRQMKQIYKLLSCPLLKSPSLLSAQLEPVSNEELQSTLQSLFSVSRIMRVNKGFGWRNLNP
ncbi:dermonecrotic toxin domain-containing protein [Pseudomonas sp. PSKL.D1]|uniref:dermonecrotic toxin domain-containing protein n=1 Tax=Pseudomonas sp. PSKL.D1 TaxID=3029060 RepID=UPI002380FA22|nr:DUF6543 domain-containing protein [Pseudomonas sp. PSKL.D1]WDY59512.1 glycosyltransferase [Pseudomonas sp. PSKL.D1]